MNTKTQKTIKLNLIIIAMIHLFCTTAFSGGRWLVPTIGGHVIPIVLSPLVHDVSGVLVQYWLSFWVMDKYVVKDKMTTSKTTFLTWGVSIYIFLFRILLGVLIFGAKYYQ